MTVSPDPTRPGGLFEGRYSILKKLGSGSFGTVYLAKDLTASRLVALKVIRTDRRSPSAITRMQDEFRALVSLEHDQIAGVHDFGYSATEQIPFYTREYIEGRPLEPGPTESEHPSRFLRPLLDLLDALHYAHEQGVLHLDIHRGNLIVARDERRGAVLIDFALGHSQPQPLLTISHGAAAPPPEMIGGGITTARTDVFLAGQLLYERLTGRRDDRPRLPREIPGWGTRMTLELERIIAKAVQRVPAERFTSAAEFRQVLSEALGEDKPRPRVVERQDLIVGRDKEILRIETTLRAAVRGQRDVLWLVGKRGTGRSRLLNEARLRAQLRGLATVEVRFVDDGATGSRLLTALERLPSKVWSDAGWLGLLAPRHGGSPKERAERAADACVAALIEPLVILADDLDSADEESRVLMNALARACSRRDRDPGVGGALSLMITSTEISPGSGVGPACRLRPLTAADARRLLVELLEPLAAPASILKRAVREARGAPGHLRLVARALREAWSPSGLIPRTAEIPSPVVAAPSVGELDWTKLRPVDREILALLAVLERPATREELAIGIPGETPHISSGLGRLVKAVLIVREGRGPGRHYRLVTRELANDVRDRVPPNAARSFHERLSAFLRQRPGKHARDFENLTRHLLALGDIEAARETARRATALLCEGGSYERAVALLKEVAREEPNASRRLEMVEAISSILEETGDHEKGIAILEPWREAEPDLSPSELVGAKRRLGVHYHRAGRSAEALSVFEDVLRTAEPTRDLEDLILVESELAELLIFRGSFDPAEEACRRGLGRLKGQSIAEDFRVRMEMMLYASLGHIEMRRLELKSARKHLERALGLSRRHGTTAEQAAIRHNLGITASQLDDYREARNHLRHAESLLLAAGEKRHVIKIATNLALIEAKLGRANEARLELDRATELLRSFPGRRLDFFVDYSRGIVALLGGGTEASLEAMRSALDKGRRLGDLHLVSFGEIYQAEAYLLSGRYAKCLRRLRSTARARASESPLLARMAYSRLYTVEAILGHGRRAARTFRQLEETPRTSIEFLEAWNDLYIGAGHLLSGDRETLSLEDALATFHRAGVPFGVRAARLLLLSGALLGADRRQVASALSSLDQTEPTPHAFLAVAEALMRAESCFFVGQSDTTSHWLSKASSEIVGTPFLELDLRIELLHSRVASRAGDTGEARRHLRRALHTRGLLVRDLPAKYRESFLAHPRFAALRDSEKRLEERPKLELRTGPSVSTGYQGLVGTSPGMVRVFDTIEQLRDQDIPVLIRGETGTGKELVARAIHARSRRYEGPFLALHCPSLPEDLFASELFGHEAGAFSGADADRPGLLEELAGGTLLLDDIGELAPASQLKLLRVLGSGTIRRLGATERRELDVRFLAASSTELKAPRTGTDAFRQDLYFRIAAVEIQLPALRERPADVLHLARHVLAAHAARFGRPTPSLDSGAATVLEGHHWPGNVRELETVLLRVLLHLDERSSIAADDIKPHIDAAPRGVFGDELLGRSLEEWKRDLEKEYLERLFLELRGDTEGMLKRLGVGRTKLYSWMRELGIDIAELRKRL